jgi:hypothetical protein
LSRRSSVRPSPLKDIHFIRFAEAEKRTAGTEARP